MKTPYWCTSAVHEYGGRKIVSGTYFGFLGDRLLVLEKQVFTLTLFLMLLLLKGIKIMR